MAQNVNMQNVINKVEVYRSKSIMIMEAQVSVQYNAATPMIQFRFATRNSASEGGNWHNNQNAYWFPTFASLAELVTQMGILLNVEAGSDSASYQFKNPKKQKYLTLRKNLDNNKNIWYMFAYNSGSQDSGNQFKTSCSCTPNEFTAIYAYLKNLLSQYPVVAQMALNRYDFWFQHVGKNKMNQGGGNNGGGYQNQGGGYQNQNQGGYQQNNGNRGGYQNQNQGGGYQNQGGGYQNQGGGNNGGGYQNQGGGNNGGGYQNQGGNPVVDQNMMDQINNEFGGAGVTPDDDIPF